MWTTEYFIKIAESKSDKCWKYFALIFCIIAGLFLTIVGLGLIGVL